MKYKLRTIKNVSLKDKRVLLRTGWDVPLKKSKVKSQKSKVIVADDLRIRESWPTLRYLIEHGVSSITIAFHIDRPGGQVVEELSVEPVAERFAQILNEPGIRNHESWTVVHHNSQFIIHHSDLRIIVLENLRFDPREEANHESFAPELAQGHDIYVNDAFDNCHRAHASMVAITKFLPAYAGLLVENELKHLSLLQHNQARPFIVIIGGAKIEDKLAAIDALAKDADAVLLGGKTGLIYKSKVNSQKSKIISPFDDHDGYDIGPKTIELFVAKIQSAQTIFWNGNLGMSEDVRYAQGTRSIVEAIAKSSAIVKIAGGGDTTAFIHQAGLVDQFTFLSSGGGATLDYLAGKVMPGLEAIRAN